MNTSKEIFNTLLERYDKALKAKSPESSVYEEVLRMMIDVDEINLQFYCLCLNKSPIGIFRSREDIIDVLCEHFPFYKESFKNSDFWLSVSLNPEVQVENFSHESWVGDKVSISLLKDFNSDSKITFVDPYLFDDTFLSKNVTNIKDLSKLAYQPLNTTGNIYSPVITTSGTGALFPSGTITTNFINQPLTSGDTITEWITGE